MACPANPAKNNPIERGRLVQLGRNDVGIGSKIDPGEADLVIPSTRRMPIRVIEDMIPRRDEIDRNRRGR